MAHPWVTLLYSAYQFISAKIVIPINRCIFCTQAQQTFFTGMQQHLPDRTNQAHFISKHDLNNHSTALPKLFSKINTWGGVWCCYCAKHLHSITIFHSHSLQHFFFMFFTIICAQVRFRKIICFPNLSIKTKVLKPNIPLRFSWHKDSLSLFLSSFSTRATNHSKRFSRNALYLNTNIWIWHSRLIAKCFPLAQKSRCLWSFLLLPYV